MISFGIIFFLLAVGSIHSQYYAGNPPYPARPAYGWNVANITNPGYHNYQSQVQYQAQPQPRYPSPGVYRNLQPNNTGNMIFRIGSKSYNDQMLLQKTVYRNKQWYKSSVYKTVTLQPKSGFNKTITCMEVWNHAKDGSVPSVKVLSGGPGKNHTTMELKSEDAPLNATVYIFGKQL